jgi:DNA-binding response OmpR family regulator
MTNQRILVVDDDPLMCALMGRYLKAAGYESVRTLSASAGLAVLRTASPPRIVISDWMMPNMSGLEFCRTVRADASIPHVYFIIVSAMTEQGCAAEALKAGADHFLTKPLEYDQMLARLRIGQRVIEQDLQVGV